MNFQLLVTTIQQTHGTLQQSALKAVNKHLTIRNWLVGFYIVEFEQKGEDRARYGENLLSELVKSVNIKGLSLTNLRLNRQFYNTYPQIHQTLSDEFRKLDFYSIPIRQTASDELQNIENQQLEIVQFQSAQFTDEIPTDLQVPQGKLLNYPGLKSNLHQCQTY